MAYDPALQLHTQCTETHVRIKITIFLFYFYLSIQQHYSKWYWTKWVCFHSRVPTYLQCRNTWKNKVVRELFCFSKKSGTSFLNAECWLSWNTQCYDFQLKIVKSSWKMSKMVKEIWVQIREKVRDSKETFFRIFWWEPCVTVTEEHCSCIMHCHSGMACTN